MRRLWVGLALVSGGATALLGACTETRETTEVVDPSGGMGGTPTTGGMGGEGGMMCGTAQPSLDTDGLVELAWDDGTPFSSVRQQTFSVTSSQNVTFALNDHPLHEAVRFDLKHPARIHGFQVMWADMPDDYDAATEIAAGLYADFGHNGFDFWAEDPLWEGTRCAEDIDDAGAWTTYAFAEPIDVPDPGLIYVAHRAEPMTPTWWFDETVASGEDPCATFGLCQSAFNLPTADQTTMFNGLSFPFQNHFMVRLYVEYTDDVQPQDKIFQRAELEHAGAHVSWGDYDDDGFDDLLVGNRLFRNLGDGTFEDVTGVLGASITNGVWGDYDNDGCLDLFGFVENHTGADQLLHNDCAGGFDIVTDSEIVDFQDYEPCGDVTNTVSPSASAAWVDLDADGFLDLYIANFICWGNGATYVDTVYMNDGDGTFTDVTSTFDDTLRTPSRAVVPIDHDGDGDMDIHVGNYRLVHNLLWQNNGDGTFEDAAWSSNLAGVPNFGYYGHTIGIAWGDLDNDGDFDNITSNLAHPRFFHFSDKTQVFINDGAGVYTDNSGDWSYPASANGLRFQETHSVPVLADFDNDGALDLVISAIYDGRPTDFYWGNGDGTFTLDAYHAGITATNGWGTSASDYDNDGDVDVFLTWLYENTGTPDSHWLQTRVVGVTANQAGIGATVRVTTGSVTRMRHVQGGSGKGGQDSLYLHFGLGDADTVDEIRVTFPGGAEVVYPGPINADQRVWLVQDTTVAQPGWTRP